MTQGYSAKILLVDDDELVSVTLAAILRRAGHAVTTALDGMACLSEMQSQEFDLVITDIMMPEKDGIETILEIRRINPLQKVIAISGGSPNVKLDYLNFAEKLGADGILQKPIGQAELLTMVASLLK